MPIDPRIAMGFQTPQPMDVMQTYGNVMKLRGLQQQNALVDQQMADAERQRVAANALSEAYRTAYNPETGELNYNALAGNLAQSGQGAAIPGLFKSRDEALKARYESVDSYNKALIQEGNLFKAQLQQLDPSDPNAPTLMAQFIRGHHAPGSLTAELLKRQGISPEQSLSALDNAVKTGKFGDFLARSQLGADEWIKRNTLSLRDERELAGQAETRAETRRASNVREGMEERKFGLEERKFGLEEKKEQRLAGAPGEPLAPKERQAREAKYPQASAAFRAANNEIDTLIKDLKNLRNHRGLGGITGSIEGRLPSVMPGSTAAQALLDKVLARGQFRELQNMRNASPTGGALGNVSNKENEALKAAFAALDQRQGATDFQSAIDDAISQLEFSKNNISQAFQDTYSYRDGASVAPSAPAGSGTRKTKSGVTYTVED